MPREEVNFDALATLIDERDRDTRIIVSEGYPMSLEGIRAKLEEIFAKRNINHEIRTVDMGYFQRGGAAATKDILLASWLGYKMVVNAFNKCESGFYTAYNVGKEPTVLPLIEAVKDETSHLDIPQDLLDFAQAMK